MPRRRQTKSKQSTENNTLHTTDILRAVHEMQVLAHNTHMCNELNDTLEQVYSNSMMPGDAHVMRTDGFFGTTKLEIEKVANVWKMDLQKIQSNWNPISSRIDQQPQHTEKEHWLTAGQCKEEDESTNDIYLHCVDVAHKFTYIKRKIDPKNSNQYLLDGQWESFEIEEDDLAFKLFGFLRWSTKQKFRYSRFGPVLEMKGKYFALRHINQNSFAEIEGWYEIGNTSSVYEFEMELAKRKIPSFNFVTMDSNRNIGYFYNGRIPHRHDALKARQIIISSSSKDIWDEGNLVNDLPKFINPANGWIQSTNQNPFSVMGEHSLKKKSVKGYVHFEQRLTNRSFVANELLSSNEKVNLNQFIKIKFDNSYSKNSRQYKFLESIIQFDKGLALASQNWNGKTDFDNTDAAMGMCFMAQEWISEMNTKPTPSYESAKQECDSLFQQIQRSYSDQWGLINTISRGSRTYPIQGSVDTLRAVYGTPNPETKSLNMSGGDGLFFIIAEEDKGKTIYGMHNYGSSRNQASVHYSDQTYLFSQEALRFIPTSL